MTGLTCSEKDQELEKRGVVGTRVIWRDRKTPWRRQWTDDTRCTGRMEKET